MRKLQKIVQVSTTDRGGGAHRVAYDLFDLYRQRGYSSWFVVGKKYSKDSNVFALPKFQHLSLWKKFCQKARTKLASSSNRNISRIRYVLGVLEDGWMGIERELGRENFNYPASRKLLELLPERPDIVHIHNLHPNYFDLRYLSYLSHQHPVVMTMHDAWLLSGHCAHPFACQRWLTGCGNCPDLRIYPAIKRDSTALNWQRKASIYRQSRLFIVTPSHWLMEKVEKSMLVPGIVDATIISNGVDTTIFYPTSKYEARDSLNLPQDANILLFVADFAGKNMFKDHKMLEVAIQIVAMKLPNERKTIFIALGGESRSVTVGPNTEIRYIPFSHGRSEVARYYQAADLYLHAALAENFPLAILEAMACGAPVIATAVGGIPEQVNDGVTGYLVKARDSQSMAEAVLKLIENRDLQQWMGDNATRTVVAQYTLSMQADRYLDWYHSSLERYQQVIS